MADTWAEVIRDALLEIGAIDPGETLDVDEELDAFRRLQGMFDEWGLEGMLVPGLQTITHTFTTDTAGLAVTFGPDQERDADDPDITTAVKIEEIDSLNFQRDGHQRSRPLDPASYSVISELRRSYRYWPRKYYFDAAYPIAKIWFDAHAEAGDFMEITGRGHFSSDITIRDETATILPKGYREPVLLNLAVKLGPSYGAKGGRDATVSDETKRAAERGKRMIKSRNLQIVEARMDPALYRTTSSQLSRRTNTAGW